MILDACDDNGNPQYPTLANNKIKFIQEILLRQNVYFGDDDIYDDLRFADGGGVVVVMLVCDD